MAYICFYAHEDIERAIDTLKRAKIPMAHVQYDEIKDWKFLVLVSGAAVDVAAAESWMAMCDKAMSEHKLFVIERSSAMGLLGETICFQVCIKSKSRFKAKRAKDTLDFLLGPGPWYLKVQTDDPDSGDRAY